MTKAEEAEKAWRLGFRGDFSIVDSIFHQTKFRALDQGAIYHGLVVVGYNEDHLVVFVRNSDIRPF